ncbi:MAG: hypothetical protein K9N38_10280 [Candidatus Marinimicrobia bacterium]|nr:hypothetical protein [Candidatus Neomarinimicrobiota bacterium]
MNKRLLNLFTIVVSVAMIAFTGCEELTDGVVSEEDSTAAVAKTDSATMLMEGMMNNMFNADPDSVEEMLELLDFGDVYDLYSEAHALDPANSDANFGLAFTGFIMLTQDQDLQDMLLRWEDYFSVNEPFLVSEGNTLGRQGFGMPLSIDGFKIPVLPYLEMPVSLMKMSTGDVPQFSEFQDLVGTLFLPFVEESITALELVDDDPNYVFIISPTMQGESEATPIELDLTEIYAIEAGLYALKGVLNTVIAYNFDFVSFDSVGIVTELNQGSDFATLNPDGAADLAEALSSITGAFNKIYSALDFLEAETDDQSDDLITLEEGDDLTEIRADIEEVEAVFEGPNVIHYSYWEDEYDEGGMWTGEVFYEDSLTVDISKFFTNPISDLKAMVPPYTMGTRLYYSSDYYSESEHVVFEESSVSVPNLNDTPVSLTLRLDTYPEGPEITAIIYLGSNLAYDLSSTSQSNVPMAVWDLYADFIALTEDYTGDQYSYQYISFYWSGTATTGAALRIEGDYTIQYEMRSNTYVEPEFSWNAASYSEWLAGWPDPTLNGIFPGLDAAGLAELLDFDQEDWDEMDN